MDGVIYLLELCVCHHDIFANCDYPPKWSNLNYERKIHPKRGISNFILSDFELNVAFFI